MNVCLSMVKLCSTFFSSPDCVPTNATVSPLCVTAIVREDAWVSNLRVPEAMTYIIPSMGALKSYFPQ